MNHPVYHEALFFQLCLYRQPSVFNFAFTLFLFPRISAFTSLKIYPPVFLFILIPASSLFLLSKVFLPCIKVVTQRILYPFWLILFLSSSLPPPSFPSPSLFLTQSSVQSRVSFCVSLIRSLFPGSPWKGATRALVSPSFSPRSRHRREYRERTLLNERMNISNVCFQPTIHLLGHLLSHRFPTFTAVR